MAEPTMTHQAYKEGVHALIRQFSTFGATPDGGVNRLAATSEDKAARDCLCQWFETHGFVTLVDPVGNIFGVLELDPSQPDLSFFCGSHLDSQPQGGRFDGTLGVVMACIAGLAMKDLVKSGAIQTAYRNYVIACWTSEEGARFQPSLLGSRVFASNMSRDDAWRVADADGISLKEALAEIDYLGSDTPPAPGHYLEVHIEQGTQLEDNGLSVGLVSCSWGARKLRLAIKGKKDHTGPTPMALRKDALLAASQLVLDINAIAQSLEQPLHSSAGRLEISPNSPNTVASKADLWVEFRAADDAHLDTAEAKLRASIFQTEQQTGCSIVEVERDCRPVVSFDQVAHAHVSKAMDRADIPHLSMTTIAGHDALQLQSVCPSTLIFVSSKGGISHSPDEFTSDDDINVGFDALVTGLSALLSLHPSNPAQGPVHAHSN